MPFAREENQTKDCPECILELLDVSFSTEMTAVKPSNNGRITDRHQQGAKNRLKLRLRMNGKGSFGHTFL